MTKSFICTIAATSVAVFAFAAVPTIAHAKTAKACEADWKAGKADIQKSGKKKTDFMTECRASDSAAKADTKAASTPTVAPAKTAKACEADWKAGKADIQKSGKTKKDFMTECRASDSSAKAATTTDTKAATAPAAAPAPAKPTATAPEGQPGRVAFIARERACGSDWKADKAAGKTGDQKWPQYWSDCNKRKKSQGM